MKRARGVDGEDAGDVRKEEILDQTTNEYEAIVAIAREARRLNAVPGVFLGKDERAIPRAFDNFVGGKVEYVVEGEEGEACASGAGPKKKAAKRVVKRASGKAAGKGAKKSGKKK